MRSEMLCCRVICRDVLQGSALCVNVQLPVHVTHVCVCNEHMYIYTCIYWCACIFAYWFSPDPRHLSIPSGGAAYRNQHNPKCMSLCSQVKEIHGRAVCPQRMHVRKSFHTEAHMSNMFKWLTQFRLCWSYSRLHSSHYTQNEDKMLLYVGGYSIPK